MNQTLLVVILVGGSILVWGGAGFALGWRIGRDRLALEVLGKVGPRPGKTAHLGSTVARNPQQRDLVD